MESVFKSEKRIRLGIWGLGRGARFMDSAKALNIDVVAGCDINGKMCDNFRKIAPDAFVTGNEDEFLAQDFDAVLIATFFTAHADHTVKALAAGKHVMCEVTSFFTPGDGVRVAEAVEKSGKVYNLLENYPFMKKAMYLRGLWDKGFFGEFMYGEFEYAHECRTLCYAYNIPDFPPVEPGWTAHDWRSWLNFHYYCTHSLGPLMQITKLRPESVAAPRCDIHLPGYLGNGDMGTACSSLIKMSNGGVMRNFVGATTGDNHSGFRIWGTRASADGIHDDLSIRVGGCGGGTRLPVAPEWPEHKELANSAGHGGGDFWELYYFAREILTGEKAPWDIWSACDVTLAGIMAIRSGEQGGAAIRIPDFRKKEDRDAYRNDFGAQKHFDPRQLFPAGHQTEITRHFSPLMAFLTGNNGCSAVRKAVDGITLFPQLSSDTGKLNVVHDVAQCLRALPEIREAIPRARTVIAAYPGTLPAIALQQMIDVIADDLTDDLEQKLETWLENR